MDALRKNNAGKTDRLNDVISSIIIGLIMIAIAIISVLVGVMSGLVVSGVAWHESPTLSFGSAWNDFGLAVAIVVGIVWFFIFGAWALTTSVSKMAYTVSHD